MELTMTDVTLADTFTMHDTHLLALIAVVAGIILIIFAALYLVSILFCLSLYKGLKLVPESKLEFPAWFAWMLLVPLAGLVFSWIVLPFSVPKSFERMVAGNFEAEKKARSLFGLGLALVILETVALIPYLNILVAIPVIVVWIIYWVRIVEFRKAYLGHR